jgi:hypothetical protein
MGISAGVLAGRGNDVREPHKHQIPKSFPGVAMEPAMNDMHARNVSPADVHVDPPAEASSKARGKWAAKVWGAWDSVREDSSIPFRCASSRQTWLWCTWSLSAASKSYICSVHCISVHFAFFSRRQTLASRGAEYIVHRCHGTAVTILTLTGG